LKVSDKRTFLHVVAIDVEKCKVTNSKSEPLIDFSNRSWFSSISTDKPALVTSNVSGSQRQQGRLTALQLHVFSPKCSSLLEMEMEMEVGQQKVKQLDDLIEDKTWTGPMIEDKDGPIDPLWSEGSELHQTGQCVPCAHFFKSRGCSLASACNFCHKCPEGEQKRRREVKDAQLRQQRIEQSQKAALPPGRV